MPGLLNTEEQQHTPCWRPGWCGLGRVMTSPSGTKLSNWTMVTILHISQDLASLNWELLSPFNDISMLACMWRHDKNSIKCFWPSHITGLYKATLVASRQPVLYSFNFLVVAAALQVEVAQEWLHLSRSFWSIAKMGLDGPRWVDLLVGRDRRCFPPKGVKEEMGRLVGGWRPLLLAYLLAEGTSVYTLS